jgi:hypothetical protein
LRKLPKWIYFVTFYIVLLGGGWVAGQWLPGLIDLNITPRSEPLIHNVIMTTMVIFILASALPFVPGAEIGFGFIMLFGGKIAPLVYAGMVSALLIAFLVGRLVPLSVVASFLRRFGLKKAAAFLSELAEIDSEQQLMLLTRNSPSKIATGALRHRFILLAVILNLPGNSLIGGGGGIALIAGVSKMFSVRCYVLTVLIAVLPVPLFFLLTQ